MCKNQAQIDALAVGQPADPVVVHAGLRLAAVELLDHRTFAVTAQDSIKQRLDRVLSFPDSTFLPAETQVRCSGRR